MVVGREGGFQDVELSQGGDGVTPALSAPFQVLYCVFHSV